jgi:hypothetical protein
MEAVNVRHQRELEAAATREEQLHQKVRLLSFVDLKVFSLLHELELVLYSPINLICQLETMPFASDDIGMLSGN